MADIVLHHYPPSPVSEKVRVALGIKGLAWRSVEIPRLPPKPLLMPLTGGYRRTPVMQIGADIYCDSQCILQELERRFPDPGRADARGTGLAWTIGRWTDAVFDSAVRLSLAANADQLPADFARDRTRLFLGPSGDLAKLRTDIPHLAAQLRAQFAWLDDWLSRGNAFVLGDRPGVADALCYYLVWFVRGRWQGGPAMLAAFPALEAWEQRIKAIGHGSAAGMRPEEALDLARASTPETEAQADPDDPQGLAPGMTASVVCDADSGETPVTGTVHLVARDRIALLREDPEAGTVCVHFPRVGYRVRLP